MRVALVTGAGGGIGRAVSIALSKRGFHVFLAGRRPALLDETAALCAGGAEAAAADVADASSVAALFERVRAGPGRLDLLFNNAGTNAASKPIDELEPADIEQVIATNLVGSLLCAREAFRLMKAQTPQGGRIINNGSVSCYGPRPFSTPYTAAKSGVTGLTKSLILDGRAYSIATCQIDIGNAASERTARMATGVMQANGTIAAEPRLDLELVAEKIADMAMLPLEVNMPFVTIMPTAMPLYGRG